VLGFRGDPDDRLLMEAVLPLLQVGGRVGRVAVEGIGGGHRCGRSTGIWILARAAQLHPRAARMAQQMCVSCQAAP
jgi:hypothetical protein